MFQKKHFFLFLYLTVFLNTLFAQEKELAKIDIADLKKHLSFISSDSLQGRQLGTETNGLDLAADYIASHLKNLGLKPGADNYFQKVELVSLQPIQDASIKLHTKKGEIFLETSELIDLSSTKKTTELFNKELVFLGFGEGEYATKLIEGKIVVIAQGEKDAFNKEESYQWNNRLERKKIETLSKNKPAALLIVSHPKDSALTTYNRINRWYNRPRYSLEETGTETESVPTLIVKPELMDKILGADESYTAYLNSVVAGKSNGIKQPGDVLMQLKSGKVSEKVSSKNIIGIVEGSDPELRKECVIFMAHYDHLGVDEEGDVYNGADDNGSGTVTLMELAEAFSSLENKPKRSVVFLWVTAEEIGLMGSKYYTENPVFPLNKTKVCVNIDMDGRVFEPRDTVWKRSPKMVKDFDGLFTLSNKVWPGLQELNNRNCKKLGIIPDNSLPENFLRSSDHYHFHNNNVPIINYATGYHADYHKVTDEIDKINFEKIKRVSDLCFLVGYEIANLEKFE